MSDKKRPMFSLEEEEEPKSEPVPRHIVKQRSGTQDLGQEADIRKVVIVGIDIPMSNIILLFLKFFLVVIPGILILGALLAVVWELATHGTL